jgi:hypothetical protein
MLLMHELFVHKNSIRLWTKASKKKGPLMLNHNVVGLDPEFEASQELKSKMSGNRQRAALGDRVTIHLYPQPAIPRVPIKLQV